MLNIGSITKIEIAPAADITLGAPNVKNEVTVTNAGSWVEPEFTLETASWNESEKASSSGPLYASKLNYQLPKVMPDNHQASHQFTNIPLVIRITDGNANKILMGTPASPVFIKVAKKIPERTAGTNAYKFEVKFESPRPAYFSA